MAFALAGCSLLPGPAPETFELSAPSTIPRLSSGTAAQILIPEAGALKAIDTQRIIVAQGPKISYYPKAQWPDTITRVVQAKAIEAFEVSERARGVGRPGEGLSIDYQLLTTIRAFEYRASAHGGDAYIEVFARLMDDRNGRIIATRQFTGSAPVVRDTAEDVVAGLNAALDAVLVDIVRWTLGVI